MNHKERVHAALRNEPVDHAPVALWRHFPKDDLQAEGLAARVVEFQNKYDFDIVKVTPAAGYPAEMYGAILEDAHNREGTRTYSRRPVSKLADWDTIEVLEATNAVTRREARAVELVRRQLGDAVPILQTVFSPLSSARNLVGERLIRDLHDSPEKVERALGAIAETTIRFAEASLRSGATAVFFATQMAAGKYLSEEEFVRFDERYALQVIEAIRGKADFILLHVHGLEIHFDRVARWPVQMLNWHDRRTQPSLRDARAKTGLALAGGVDEWGTLAGNSRAAVIAEVQEAVAQAGDRGFMVAPGCVIPIDTPGENILAVLEAVRGKGLRG